MAAARRAVDKYSNKWVGKAVLTPTLAAIRLRYRLTSLTLIREGNVWAIEGAVNPRKKWVTSVRVNVKDYSISTKEPALRSEDKEEGDTDNPWTDDIKRALVVELEAAVKTFLANGLTDGQAEKLKELKARAIAAKQAGENTGPHWGKFWKCFYRWRGERIHAAFKSTVALNPTLSSLTLFTPGVAEPDIYTTADTSGRWWADVTTEGEWSAHYRDYNATFGNNALGIIYRIKNTKHAP